MPTTASLLDYHLLVEAYRQRAKLQNVTIEDITVILEHPGGHGRDKVKSLIKRGVFAFAHHITISGNTHETYSFNEEGWEKALFSLDAVRCGVSYIINKTGKNWAIMYCPYPGKELKDMLEEFRLNG